MNFQFKQFVIEQEKCAMKVGTDAVLLGAWAKLPSVDLLQGDLSKDKKALKILDIGTGTGILALILAQRLACQGAKYQVHALEKDFQACQQAQGNFANSPWRENLVLCHGDVLKVLPRWQREQKKFDGIIINPPYFEAGVACGTKERNLARYHQNNLIRWLTLAMNCLEIEGKLNMVLPLEIGLKLVYATEFFCSRECQIITKTGKASKRILLTFSHLKPLAIEKNQLTILDINNQYTAEFKALTRDFYLKF